MLKRSVVVLVVLLAGACLISTVAIAEEPPSPKAIECALDPQCPKPPPMQPRVRSLKRGVVIEGAPAEQPLSINLYVNFDFNSANLTSDARITLDRLGAALSDPRLADFSFVIAGHTDAVGGDEFNQKLSERRAAVVRDYLIAQFKIDGGRLTAKGYGKSQLLDPSRPEDGVNRRVQIINATAASKHN
jgi:outer membrane protein OmpA-like peptidoglycan-associated protein